METGVASSEGDSSPTKMTNGIPNGLESPEKSKEHKSSHRDREHKSSHSHKHKHKDRDRERDRDRDKKDKDRHRDRHHDKDKESHRDKDREKEKERHKEERHKDDRHKSSKDKDHHRDKDKKSSSSSSRDKEKSSSSKDRDREREKEKERSKDKDRHERSSEKHRDKHREKDRSKDKDRHRSHDKSDREKSRSSSDKRERKEEVQVKQEPVEEVTNGEVDLKEMSADEDQLVIDERNVKEEVESDDEPLAKRLKPSPKDDEDSDDDIPLSAKRVKIEKRKLDVEDEDFAPAKKKKKKEEENLKKKKKKVKEEDTVHSPQKGRKKDKDGPKADVWKWWEEEKTDDNRKWRFLEHKGPVFAPLYERLPNNIKFFYDGDEMDLSELTEEVAGFYARMLDHDYTTMDTFNKNFMHDWRKVMTEKERRTITDLNKCDFTKMHEYFKMISEEKKNRTKEEKAEVKVENERQINEYGFCKLDGYVQRIGNFKIEPPGLFRGRGNHPKMGKLKNRVLPEDVIINCSRDSVIPKPPEGHRWKEVRHDSTVTWLASWTENVQGQVKYIMLNAASRLKGEKDWMKYETARKLHKIIDQIRSSYWDDMRSKEMRIRQRAVAMYLIDKLALRAGNEKDEDQADTVGCCSLRVEHISLEEHKDGKDYVVIFDFLGKDSIRYYNEVAIEKRVFKNIGIFMENKDPGDDLFDRLTTATLNKHLQEIMEGLTAKVFRTYNASVTLQDQLDKLTNDEDPIPAKILSYNRANRAVAILCNHQRSVPKTHQKSMENLQAKIDAKEEVVAEAERAFKQAKKAYKSGKSSKEKIVMDKKKKALERARDGLAKLEMTRTDKEEGKEIALGTSKLNYLDPRISVAWSKKHEVPVEKVYNKTQREKFSWAIEMAGEDFIF